MPRLVPDRYRYHRARLVQAVSTSIQVALGDVEVQRLVIVCSGTAAAYPSTSYLHLWDAEGESAARSVGDSLDVVPLVLSSASRAEGVEIDHWPKGWILARGLWVVASSDQDDPWAGLATLTLRCTLTAWEPVYDD